MTVEENTSPWLCHVCNRSSNLGEGQACSECFKIACQQHMLIATVHNPDSGLYELKPICVECQLQKDL